MSYNPRARTAGGNRARLGANAGGLTSDMLRLISRISIEMACAEGRHRTETDAETGDEVCRACGTVVEL